MTTSAPYKITSLRHLGLMAVFILFLSCLTTPALAQAPPDQAERMQYAIELVGLMGMDEYFSESLSQLSQAVAPGFLHDKPGFSPQEMRAFLTALGATLYDHLRPDLMNGVAQVYARQFSAAELKKLVAFHASPEGRKMIRLQKELFKGGQEVGVKVIERFFKGLRDDPELKKKFMAGLVQRLPEDLRKKFGKNQ